LQFFGKAAGVEPDISVENTQLTDSENASIAENATISKSAVQSLYKDCLEFPELQLSDFPASCKNTLKRSCSISDVGLCKPQGNGEVAAQPALDFGLVDKPNYLTCNCSNFDDRIASAIKWAEASMPRVLFTQR
jgi:hypothetical protein